jgi:hypothetical protein
MRTRSVIALFAVSLRCIRAAWNAQVLKVHGPTVVEERQDPHDTSP